MLKTSESAIEEIRLASEPDVRIGDAWLRPASRRLEFGGGHEMLEPRVAQLIAALARRPNGVVSRDTLVDLCWGGRIVGDDALNRCVAKARKAALRAGFEITTVPKVGYRLAAPVEQQAPRWRARPWLVGGIAALVLAAIGGWVMWDRPPAARPEYPPIAVGEFTTSSDRRELRRSTGDIGSQVVDALLNTGIPSVRHPALAIDGARYLVRGEVSERPDGIRALVQLDDLRTTHTVFSRELALDADEAPLLADKVAATVADAVTRTGAYYVLTASGADRQDTDRFLVISLQIAAGDYLEAEAQARQFMESRPRSRVAPFALSLATIYALPQLPIEERPGAIARARRASMLARQRLPQFGAVYISRCKLNPVDYASCEKALREALALDPAAPTVRMQLALLLMDAGRLEEARPLMTRALGDNPFNPSKVIQALYLAQLTGARSEEAYGWSYAQRYWPKRRFAQQRFMSLMANGRWKEAEEMVPQVVRISPGAEDSLTAVFTALHAPTESNKQAVHRLCGGELEPASGVSCFTALSMLGLPATAIQVARRFYPTLQSANPANREALFIANGSDPGPLFFLWGEGAKAMRQEPGFAALAEQVGLVGYWKVRGAPDVCRRESTPACKLAAH
jgi:DNA-binding winged helix-turn-helix (wHTH) protein/tetratricopeptide (TPR) repeat protein